VPSYFSWPPGIPRSTVAAPLAMHLPRDVAQELVAAGHASRTPKATAGCGKSEENIGKSWKI